MSSQAPIVILGAGCAGLAAARRMQEHGYDCVLIEASNRVGGLAGGILIGGSIYEYGPHIFHTTDSKLLADVKDLMGGELIPYKRTIQIKFLGNYFQFPLSIPDVLLKLPLSTVMRAAASFVYRFLQGIFVKPKIETSETVLRRYYGDILYKLFFKDYIERVWGVTPAGFSPSFARERIPRLNLLEVIDKIAAVVRIKLGFHRAVGTQGYVEKVEGELYTTREGFSLITKRMAERLIANGAVIRLNTRAINILHNASHATAVIIESGGQSETLSCSAIISTIPINQAARAFLPDLGAEVAVAAQSLRFRAVVFVGLKIRRSSVLPASFMYFREHSFNRITDLSFFGFKIEPPQTTLLVAEISCDIKDPYWTNDALAREAVTADLVREGIVAHEEILETHVFHAEHAYPMYTLGYEQFLAVLLEAFGRVSNMETAGRQGRFQYINTHVAMNMGYEAADRLAARLSSAARVSTA